MTVIVCIGSGNMGVALMRGAGTKGTSIYFTDIDTDKAREAANFIGEDVLKTNTEAAEKGDFIFLAVKPQVLAKVLAEIAPVLKKRLINGNPPILVSMAAGWTVLKIQQALGIKTPVIRIMPNTPALISKGMIAFAPSPEVPEDKVREAEAILSGTGFVDKIDEHYLSAVTGLSGSGPGFVYLFIEALADGGVMAGLTREKAMHYAAQTVMGAAEMVLKTGKHPGELKDMASSPGGTTIAGISALESRGFRGTVMKAVEAAWRRAAEWELRG